MSDYDIEPYGNGYIIAHYGPGGSAAYCGKDLVFNHQPIIDAQQVFQSEDDAVEACKHLSSGVAGGTVRKWLAPACGTLIALGIYMLLSLVVEFQGPWKYCVAFVLGFAGPWIAGVVEKRWFA